VIVIVPPPLRLTPVTLIVAPETATDPVDAVTQPAALLVVGAVQPLGTVTSTSPFDVPPVAAVYVKVRVLLDVPAVAVVGLTAFVPEPLAALTVMLGELPSVSVVSVPPAVAFDWTVHVAGPVVPVAVAPSLTVQLPPDVAP
jgi:hypothetical protein